MIRRTMLIECNLFMNYLIGFIELVIYTSLIDAGYSHETTPFWPGQLLFAGRNIASAAQTSHRLRQVFNYLCTEIGGVSQTLALTF